MLQEPAAGLAAPPPAGDELVPSSAGLVPRACRLHLRAEPSYALGPRRLAGTRKREGNDSGGEVERGGRGGGRGKKGKGGREVERAAGTAE